MYVIRIRDSLTRLHIPRYLSLMFKSIPPAIAAGWLFIAINLAGQQTSTLAASATDGRLASSSPHHDAVTLPATDFKTMAHLHGHDPQLPTNADQTYSGIRLAALLAKVEAPLGSSLRAEALAILWQSGSDGYQTVVALRKVDPEFHPGRSTRGGRDGGQAP